MFPLWSTSASYILQQTSRQRPHPLISKHQNHLYRFVLSPCTPHNYGMIYDSDCTNAFTTQLLISSPRLMVLSTSLISISMVPFSSFFSYCTTPLFPNIALYSHSLRLALLFRLGRHQCLLSTPGNMLGGSSISVGREQVYANGFTRAVLEGILHANYMPKSSAGSKERRRRVLDSMLLYEA